MLALAVLVAAVLRFTRFGRHVFAVGSNEQTARLCGIDVERTKIGVYVFAAPQRRRRGSCSSPPSPWERRPRIRL